MEFMDRGSFDGIYKKIGAIDINVVCMVAHSVLEGLTYLYDVHRIIHRGEWSDSDWTSALINNTPKTSNRPTYCVTHEDRSSCVILGYQVNLSIPSRTHLWGPRFI